MKCFYSEEMHCIRFYVKGKNVGSISDEALADGPENLVRILNRFFNGFDFARESKREAKND